MNGLQQLGRLGMGSGDIVIDPNDPPTKQAQIVRTAQIVALLATQLAPECSTIGEVAAAIKRCTDAEAKRSGNSDAWVADLGITADLRTVETHLDEYDDADMAGNMDEDDNLDDDADSDGDDRMQMSASPRRINRTLFNATKQYTSTSFDARFGRLLAARGRGGAPAPPPTATDFDLIASVASSADLLVEICKHLPFRAILNLYSISRAVKATIDRNPGRIIRQLADHHAKGSARIFPYKCYPLCNRLDPTFCVTRALDPRLAPLVPNLKYLGLVTTRERMVRDILASMARAGEHLPSSTGSTLKKMWLIMDVAHNRGRRAFAASTKLVHNSDLHNMHALVDKLEKRCGDALFGPCTPAVVRALLGQRSLSTLWAVLRCKDGWRTKPALVRMKIRYDHQTTPAQSAAGRPIFGVPLYDVGTTHLEGWGAGVNHLARPDELVEAEATRRGLDLGEQDAADFFLTWGVRRDGCAGAATLQLSADDMYMSDDDLPQPARGPYADFGNVPFVPDEWRPQHRALRDRWRSLTVRDKLRVWVNREEETLRALPWTDSESITSDDFDNDMADVDDDDGDDDFNYGGGGGGAPLSNPVNQPAFGPAAFATPGLNQLPARYQNLVQSFVAQAARQFDDEQDELKAQADEQYSDADLAAWDAYLDARGPNYHARLHASAAATAPAPAPAPAPAGPAAGAGGLQQQRQDPTQIPVPELIGHLRLLGYDAENDNSTGDMQPGETLANPVVAYRLLLLARLEKEVFVRPRRKA